MIKRLKEHIKDYLFIGFISLSFLITGIVIIHQIYSTTKTDSLVTSAINRKDWFEQQYQYYLMLNSKVKKARTTALLFKREMSLKGVWKFEDTTRYLYLTRTLYELAYQKEVLVATYNARSGMISRDLFKSKKAPHRLPLSENK